MNDDGSAPHSIHWRARPSDTRNTDGSDTVGSFKPSSAAPATRKGRRSTPEISRTLATPSLSTSWKTEKRWSSPLAIPAYCEPPPGNRNATSWPPSPTWCWALRALSLRAERFDRARPIGDGDDTAHGVVPAAGRQRVGHVAEVELGMRVEVGRQPLGCVADRFRIAPGESEDLLGRRRRDRISPRRLLDDDVGVGAADAEGAHARPSHVLAGPRRRLAGQHEGGLVEVEQRARRGEVGDRRQRFVPHRLHDLDQAGDAGRGVEVADVGLRRRRAGRTRCRRSSRRKACVSAATSIGSPTACPGAVRFEQLDVASADARRRRAPP